MTFLPFSAVITSPCNWCSPDQHRLRFILEMGVFLTARGLMWQSFGIGREDAACLSLPVFT